MFLRSLCALIFLFAIVVAALCVDDDATPDSGPSIEPSQGARGPSRGPTVPPSPSPADRAIEWIREQARSRG